MSKTHAKNTVRYYIILVALLVFLFFSNDFGLIDVQKTAIVTAAGIDREEEGFILTSQIAVPKGSQQGTATESVQLVSRGKTIAEAFDQINAKTGWYPKLVFCKLILFGEEAAKQNVFDALDFFLRDEYLTDDCQVAVCEGRAQDTLNQAPLVDQSSSAAISKILSAHAERVGTTRPCNLKDFAIGYFGDSQSGFLPVVKSQPQQETPPKEDGESGGGSSDSASGETDGSSGGGGGNASGSAGGEKQATQNEPVFSARETALFVRGIWRETLTAAETFAVNAALGRLRLAGYSVPVGENECQLLVKNNAPKIKLSVGKEGKGALHISVTLTAGVADYSKAQGLLDTKDLGSPPDGAFAAAAKKLTAEITTAFEKAKNVGCDLFEIRDRLTKFKRRKYHRHANTLLSNTDARVSVKFVGVR